ncbi:MAG: hypothetical protein ACFFD4_34945 [Candidatus Odinarchaeota archaeon]
MFLMKIALVGDPKKNILNKYFKFPRTKYKTAMGVDFGNIDRIIEGKALRFQFWSLHPEELYKKLSPGKLPSKKHFRNSSLKDFYVNTAAKDLQVYFAGAQGGIVVFDTCNPESYQDIPFWIAEIWKHTSNDKIPIVISSVISQEEKEVNTVITDEEITKLAEELGKRYGANIRHIPVDERTGENMIPILDHLGKVYFQLITR